MIGDNKQERKVVIVCNDRSSMIGFIKVTPNQSTLDFINDEKENFVFIDNVEIWYTKDAQSFRLAYKWMERRSNVVLNKSAIKFIEEV